MVPPFGPPPICPVPSTSSYLWLDWGWWGGGGGLTSTIYDLLLATPLRTVLASYDQAVCARLDRVCAAGSGQTDWGYLDCVVSAGQGLRAGAQWLGSLLQLGGTGLARVPLPDLSSFGVSSLPPVGLWRQVAQRFCERVCVQDGKFPSAVRALAGRVGSGWSDAPRHWGGSGSEARGPWGRADQVDLLERVSSLLASVDRGVGRVWWRPTLVELPYCTAAPARFTAEVRADPSAGSAGSHPILPLKQRWGAVLREAGGVLGPVALAQLQARLAHTLATGPLKVYLQPPRLSPAPNQASSECSVGPDPLVPLVRSLNSGALRSLWWLARHLPRGRTDVAARFAAVASRGLRGAFPAGVARAGLRGASDTSGLLIQFCAMLRMYDQHRHLIRSAFSRSPLATAAYSGAVSRVLAALDGGRGAVGPGLCWGLDCLLRSPAPAAVLARAGSSAGDGSSLSQTAAVGRALELVLLAGDRVASMKLLQHLVCRRLLSGRLHERLEQDAVKTLRRLGEQDTARRCEQMFLDIEASSRLSAQFKADLATACAASPPTTSTATAETAAPDMDVVVLGARRWPLTPDPFTVQLPPPLLASTEAFAQFYSAKRPTRRLSWQIHVGRALLQFWVTASRCRELIVVPAQMVVLLHFAGPADVRHSAHDLADATQLPLSVLKPILVSLASPACPILVVTDVPKDSPKHPGSASPAPAAAAPASIPGDLSDSQQGQRDPTHWEYRANPQFRPRAHRVRATPYSLL